MLCQPDPLLLEMFDSLQKELAGALEESERLADTAPDTGENVSRAIVLRKIDGLRIVLTELQVALERRHSRLVH